MWARRPGQRCWGCSGSIIYSCVAEHDPWHVSRRDGFPSAIITRSCWTSTAIPSSILALQQEGRPVEHRRSDRRYERRISIELLYEGNSYDGRTRNISLGGVFIDTEHT